MKSLTPLAVATLALLNEGPMHPYEMYQLLLARHEDRLVKVRPGSLYHTVERLALDKLIVATGTEREGNRPERTTYEITPLGQEALENRVREVLTTPINEFPQFPWALGEAHNLSRDEVLAALNQHIAELDALIDEFTTIIEDVKQREIPEIYWVAGDYLRTTRLAERAWLATFIARLESKEIPWQLDT
ncbi:MAG: transcriptional regulator [Nocardioidaceae bacterium]|nr:transcriptional regulator [Nocardioidaceae bacterium]